VETPASAGDILFENAPKLRYTLNRDDVRLFGRYVYFQRRPVRTAIRVVAMVFLLLLGVIHATYMNSAGSSPASPWAFAGLLFLSPMFVWGILLLLWTLIQCFATRSPNLPEYTMGLTEYGLLSEAEGARHVYTWASIVDMGSSKHALYAFLTPAYALILPRRAFIDQADKDLWFDELKRLWQERRIAPSAPPPPANAISVTYAPTAKDFQRAYIWAASQQPQKRRRQYMVLQVIALTLGVLCLIWISFWGPPAIKWLEPILWPLNVTVTLSIIFGNRYFPRYLAQQISRIPGNLALKTMSLTANGVITRGQATWSSYPWKQVENIHSDDALIYLLLPTANVMFVPRTAFMDTEQADAFTAAARSYKVGAPPDIAATAAWPPQPFA